jgi:hypothetical protein
MPAMELRNRRARGVPEEILRSRKMNVAHTKAYRRNAAFRPTLLCECRCRKAFILGPRLASPYSNSEKNLFGFWFPNSLATSAMFRENKSSWT